MPVQALVLAGTSTPAQVAGSYTLGTNSHGYIRVTLKPIAGTAYLGDSGVTTAGYPLSTGDATLAINLLQTETLWFATSSGASVSLGVLRTGETT